MNRSIWVAFIMKHIADGIKGLGIKSFGEEKLCVFIYSLATLDKILREAVKSGVACIGCKCGQCLMFF